MSEFTYISSANIANYATLEALQDMIFRTLTRWFDIPQIMWTAIDGVYELCETKKLNLHFGLCVIGENVYQLSMNAIGRFRRHGSSCDYFEKIFDCLLVQIKYQYLLFAKMNDCLPLAFTQLQNIIESPLPTVGTLAETVIYDESEEEDSEDEEEDSEDEEEDSEDSEEEEEDSEDEDERIMSMPLRDMTDNQIDKYIYNLGGEPREEVDEWTMDFKGGAIPRYSYVNFDGAWISNQHVSNITIRRARFAGCILKNVVFEDVHFHECDFRDLVVENVTFKDCQFTDCELEPNITEFLDNSCSVENLDLEYEDA